MKNANQKARRVTAVVTAVAAAITIALAFAACPADDEIPDAKVSGTYKCEYDDNEFVQIRFGTGENCTMTYSLYGATQTAQCTYTVKGNTITVTIETAYGPIFEEGATGTYTVVDDTHIRDDESGDIWEKI